VKPFPLTPVRFPSQGFLADSGGFSSSVTTMSQKPKTPVRPLLVVERLEKGHTLAGILGDHFQVAVSVDRGVPHTNGTDCQQSPYRGETRPEVCVVTANGVDFHFLVPAGTAGGEAASTAELQQCLASDSTVCLATDDTWDGEALAWYLSTKLAACRVSRVVFRELTPSAVQSALRHPKPVNAAAVAAHQTRLILDSSVGAIVSPLQQMVFGASFPTSLVESVITRRLVARERNRMVFQEHSFWSLSAVFADQSATSSAGFDAKLQALNGYPVTTKVGFSDGDGRRLNSRMVRLDEAGAIRLRYRLEDATFSVVARKDSPWRETAPPPFTTGSLLLEAQRVCGLTAPRTLHLARSLYDRGLITFIESESTAIADGVMKALRRIIERHSGTDVLPKSQRKHRRPIAHDCEAIRPADPLRAPSEVRESFSSLEPAGLQLYSLIWRRTLASQMKAIHGQKTLLTIEACLDHGETATFTAVGFDHASAGFHQLSFDGSDPGAPSRNTGVVLFPALQTGDPVDCRSLEAVLANVEPPERYTDATLIQDCDVQGIGRPSRLAALLEATEQHGYCCRRGDSLVPTWAGFAATQFLEQHLPGVVEDAFAAQVERDLQCLVHAGREKPAHLKRRERSSPRPLHAFTKRQLNKCPGNRSRLHPFTAAFLRQLQQHIPLTAELLDGESIAAPTAELLSAACCIRLPNGMIVRVERDGATAEDTVGQQAVLPPVPSLTPHEVAQAGSVTGLTRRSRSDEPLGFCPETGRPVFARNGRYGPYVQLGDDSPSGGPSRSASLPQGMSLETLDITTAVRLLQLPRSLGPHPDSGHEVLAGSGRHGAYVTCHGESRSLPVGLSPLDITLSQAVALLQQPRRHNRRSTAGALKDLGISPVTAQPVVLRDGRFGPFISDGATNASIPKGMPPESLTLEEALELLALRANAGPRRRSRRLFRRNVGRDT
jgi:DNA topoisomerase-1